VIGDVAAVEGTSRPLILNPFHGYPETARNILDPAFENTLKAYSSLDGAVLVRGDGTVVTAGVQLVPSRSAPPRPRVW
jgi:DNA integrity scanning protein DisA with diadenylate cyclase activity